MVKDGSGPIREKIMGGSDNVDRIDKMSRDGCKSILDGMKYVYDRSL